MTMVIALGLAMALFLLSVGLHLASLGVGHRWLARRNDFAVKLAISLLVLLSHLLVVTLFATGFGLGVEWGLGTFAGSKADLKAIWGRKGERVGREGNDTPVHAAR